MDKRKYIPEEVRENAAETIASERKYIHWLDETFQQCKQSGGLDHLSGRGKPLQVHTGDPLNSILKNANVLPRWLELQHEIRDTLLQLLEMELKDENKLEKHIAEINEKIGKYNNEVPSSLLQKMKVTKDNMKDQMNKWI